MRIAYCTNVRLPSERAHGHQVARVCHALGTLGHDVHIYAPYRKNPIKTDFWEYHGVNRDKVDLIHTKSFDGISCPLTVGVLGLKMTTLSYLKKLLPLLKKGEYDIIYTRTPEILGILLSSGISVVAELHRLPRRNRKKFVMHCNKCRMIVCLTTPMRNELVKWGVPKDKIIVEGDAVDLLQFDKEKEGEPLELSKNADGRPIIGYVGALASMGLQKGVGEILNAIHLLKRENIKVHSEIVGGPDGWVSEYKKMAKHLGLDGTDVTFRGHIPSNEVPRAMKECDLLIYPAPINKHTYFMRDTSPMKIFEYMSTGKPMICADTPPIRDVLDESVTLFYEPGNVDDLSTKIVFAMENAEEMHAMAWRAKERVKEYTWDKRMERIISCV